MSEEHKKYVVLESKSINGIEKQVNDYLDNGWKPLGGVAHNSNGYYVQAMFKRNELVHERID